jgi:hypothetical protein
MLHCKNCNVEIDLKQALDHSPFSWPNLQAIWHPCPRCGTGNHIRFETDSIGIIEIIGAPGPTWEYLNRERRKGIQISSEPQYFHVWIDGIESVVEARK